MQQLKRYYYLPDLFLLQHLFSHQFLLVLVLEVLLELLLFAGF
jgi:hypothetical protein